MVSGLNIWESVLESIEWHANIVYFHYFKNTNAHIILLTVGKYKQIKSI